MKIQYTRCLLISLLLALCFGTGVKVCAQGFSPAAMEQLKMNMLWFNSQNAAGLTIDGSKNFSNVILSYDRRDGNFHNPQEGETENVVGVSSEGLVKLGGAYVWGQFNFHQENLSGAKYNASIADPLSGMPYYVVDDHASKWRNQHYDLKFRAATPLWGKHWGLGIAGSYTAELAAKQIDPRVDTRFYTLELVPSVVYRLNDHHKFGANFNYSSIKEDSRMSIVNIYVDQDYYVMYGLGTAVKGIGSGVTSNYIGDLFGGAVQYSFGTKSFNLLLEGGYDVKAETLQHSYDTPKNIAGIKEKILSLSLTAVRGGDKLTHYFKAAYKDSDMDGVQYISQRDNTESQSGWIDIYKNIRSTYKSKIASFDYALSWNRGTEYSWKIEAGVKYSKSDDLYIMPMSKLFTENVKVKLGVKKNFALGKNMNRRLLVGVHGGFNTNVDGDYVYGGSHPEYVTVTGLFKDINYYQSAMYQFGGGSLTYSQQLRKDRKANLFIKTLFDYVHTPDGDSFYDADKRTYLSVSLGFNF